MNSKPRKSTGTKIKTINVQVPKLRPKISYPRVKVLKQEPKLVEVRVKVTKENKNANPKNEGTKAQGRFVKS